MAANPGASGSAVLAVAAVGGGMFRAADPLVDLCSIFTTLVMTINQSGGMINAYILTGMYSFYYISFNDD